MNCKIYECKKLSFRKGLCRKHYHEFSGRKCKIEGCNGYLKAQGLCPKHYKKLLEYGDPLIAKLKQLHGLSVEERFWAYVGKERQNGCRVWNGYRDPNGYGRMNIQNIPVPVHRISWEIHNGPIPEGMHVLHKCDNPPCINPGHLFLGDQNDNNQDCIKKGRDRSGVSLGENHGLSKLTEKQVLEIRASKEMGIVLSKIYNVTKTTISDVRNRKIWKHI